MGSAAHACPQVKTKHGKAALHFLSKFKIQGARLHRKKQRAFLARLWTVDQLNQMNAEHTDSAKHRGSHRLESAEPPPRKKRQKVTTPKSSKHLTPDSPRRQKMQSMLVRHENQKKGSCYEKKLCGPISCRLICRWCKQRCP